MKGVLCKEAVLLYSESPSLCITQHTFVLTACCDRVSLVKHHPTSLPGINRLDASKKKKKIKKITA